VQTRSSDENCPSVYPPVHLSVKRVNCDKDEREICPDFYTIRKII